MHIARRTISAILMVTHTRPERAFTVQYVVDLQTVSPFELEALWRRDAQLWRERLFWDASDRIAALRRAFERRAAAGVALRVGARVVGYAYYVVSGRLGVLAGLDIARQEAPAGAGEALLQAALQALRQHGVTRIESPFLSFDSAWLLAAFEKEGFRSYWRDFLRLDINTLPEAAAAPSPMRVEPWRMTHLPEAAAMMRAAYDGGADAEMSMLYRTTEGCRLVLDHLLHQRNSGVPMPRASAFARHSGQGVGFIILTAISPRQAHLAQVATLPAYQGQGVGQHLLRHSLSQLAALDFDALSLIVSRDNARAMRLYQRMGFQSALAFPVFVWEAATSSATSS